MALEVRMKWDYKFSVIFIFLFTTEIPFINTVKLVLDNGLVITPILAIQYNYILSPSTQSYFRYFFSKKRLELWNYMDYFLCDS